MSIFKKLTDLFSGSGGLDRDAYWIIACCNRCGEVVRARVSLSNDLSVEYEGDETSYFCRKVLMGEGRCFQRIEVELTFDANRRLVNREIIGGQFVDEQGKVSAD